MLHVPNVRIVNHVRAQSGAILKTELLGQWFVDVAKWPDSPIARYILGELRCAKEQEPHMGWRLETRGTHAGWHEMTSAASAASAARKGTARA